MSSKIAELITIGDELLIGQTLNTNSQWLGKKLDAIGVKPQYCTTIGDNRNDILAAFTLAESRADYVFITGGLGPTKDDITKKLLCEFFETDLVIDEDRLQELTSFFEKRGYEMNDLNRQQALTPRNCRVLTNQVGTANGMCFEREGTLFFSMPGVPFEMKALVEEQILPIVEEGLGNEVIIHKVIKTIGIGESDLSILINDWEDNLPEEIGLAYLPSYGQVKLRLSGYADSRTYLQNLMDEEVDKLSLFISEYIYAFNDDDGLEKAVGQLLLERDFTLAAAESCTGGSISKLLTSVPGSSRYFIGGVVAYANDVKINTLRVSENTIQKEGAVSESTVLQMAEGVRALMGTTIGVATSGIAGPDGGSDEKPVGTIWIALSDGETKIAKELQLTNDRNHNIEYTSVAVLRLVRAHLLQII